MKMPVPELPKTRLFCAVPARSTIPVGVAKDDIRSAVAATEEPVGADARDRAFQQVVAYEDASGVLRGRVAVEFDPAREHKALAVVVQREVVKDIRVDAFVHVAVTEVVAAVIVLGVVGVDLSGEGVDKDAGAVVLRRVVMNRHGRGRVDKHAVVRAQRSVALRSDLEGVVVGHHRLGPVDLQAKWLIGVFGARRTPGRIAQHLGPVV